MIGKIYKSYKSTEYNPKNDVTTIEIGSSNGLCFINGDKNNPYTGYLNVLCNTNGILVSSDEKTIYGFIRNPSDPCDLTIFEAINMMLLGEDEDFPQEVDPRINFIFLKSYPFSYNSYLRDQNRFGPTKTCGSVDYRCN